MERCCHARCAGVPSTRSRQQHERRRAADLDIRTLHGRQAPPPGRQPTTRRQSRSHSGPLRAFQTRRCTSAYPPENPKSARQRRFSAPLAPPGPPRRHPYLEHQSDTGAPSPSWHPQAYHGVAYTDRSNARMALMAPLRAEVPDRAELAMVDEIEAALRTALSPAPPASAPPTCHLITDHWAAPPTYPLIHRQSHPLPRHPHPLLPPPALSGYLHEASTCFRVDLSVRHLAQQPADPADCDAGPGCDPVLWHNHAAASISAGCGGSESECRWSRA